MKFLFTIMLVVSLCAMALSQGKSGSTKCRYVAVLSSASRAKAMASWTIDDKPGKPKATFEIEGEKLSAVTGYIVVIGSGINFNILTNTRGQFELEIVNRTSFRPDISAGTTIMIIDASGNTVLTGVFVKK